MTCKDEYSCDLGKESGFYGYSLSSQYVVQHFPDEVKDIFFDIEGTKKLIEYIQEIDKTGFQKSNLCSAISIEDVREVEDWRVGEALAEFFIIQKFGVRSYWNQTRDLKNNNSNPTGADIVSFVDSGDRTLFAFGEIKTSGDTKSPPEVVTGRRGLKKQLEELRDDESKRAELVKYLGWKVIDLPDEHPFKQDFEKATKSYNENRCHLFGILVRDTPPRSTDIESRCRSLHAGLNPNMMLKMVAIYVPYDRKKWPSIMAG